jgi:hypothetical protein
MFCLRLLFPKLILNQAALDCCFVKLPAQSVANEACFPQLTAEFDAPCLLFMQFRHIQ